MIDPAIKEDPNYWVYQQLMEGKHFCRIPPSSSPSPFSSTLVNSSSSSSSSSPQPFVGSVWAGPSVFPDYTQEKTREWWGGLYKEMIEMGVDGFWNGIFLFLIISLSIVINSFDVCRYERTINFL